MSIPPQFQCGDAPLEGDALVLQVDQLKKLLSDGAKFNSPLEIEAVSAEVVGGHLVAVGRNVGVSKQFIRAATRLALSVDDLDILCLFFPDLHRAWRRRIELGLDGDFGLYLSRLSLQLVPKCAESWSFRRSLLPDKTGQVPAHAVVAEWPIIYAAATAHKCNYYAWEHARWLLAHTQQYDFDVFVAFMKSHVTDCSVFSFATFLVRRFPTRLIQFLELASDLTR